MANPRKSSDPDLKVIQKTVADGFAHALTLIPSSGPTETKTDINAPFRAYLKAQEQALNVRLAAGQSSVEEARELIGDAIILARQIADANNNEAAIRAIFKQAIYRLNNGQVMNTPLTRANGVTFRNLLEQKNEETLENLLGGKISPAEALQSATASLDLARQVACCRVTSQDATHFSNETRAIVAKSTVMRRLVGAIIGTILGLIIGITLGAMIGAGLGPGAAWLALEAGKKGAILGGLIGGTLGGACFYTAGERVSLWTHPMPRMAAEATEIARKLKK